MKPYQFLFFLFLILTWIVGCYLFPSIIFIILFINLLSIIALGIARIWLSTQKTRKKLFQKAFPSKPKISIHLPVCQEPPHVVCNTIRSIVNQEYSNYELIILIHQSESFLENHVKNFCQSINRPIKVRSVNFAGKNKAAALNLCHKITSNSAKYIFTLNADYWIHPKGIAKAVDQMERKACDMLQFPRAYLNANRETTGLREELDLYYQCYSNGASQKKAALAAGNLFLIKKNVLDEIGGWTEAISEEAQLGIDLLEKNYKTAYSRTIIGRGLMPHSYRFLYTQRIKWIIGNLQTLQKLYSSNNLSYFAKGILLLQLTAWINLLAFPLLSFFSGICLALAGNQVIPILILSSIALYLHLAFQTLLFGISTKFQLLKTLWGLTAHNATLFIGAFTIWNYIFFKDRSFRKSPKFKTKNLRAYEVLFYGLLLCSCAFQMVYVPTLALLSFPWVFFMLLSKLLLHFELKNSHQNLENSLYQTANQ